MLKRSIMSAAIAAALGLGMGFAAAQSVSEEEIDMTAGDVPGLEQQGGDDRNELKDRGAAAGQHEEQAAQPDSASQDSQHSGGQAPQHQTGESQEAGEEQIGQSDEQSGHPGGNLPDADQAAQQGAQPVPGDSAGQTAQPGEDEEMSADRSGTRAEEETTGQGQGVRDSGGAAGVQTPAQSADSPADHDTHSGEAGGTGSDANR